MEIRCTNCGADLPLEKESDFISCAYCSAALYVDVSSTVTSYYMRPELQRADLSPALSRKLAAMDILPDHEIKQAKMVFHPFWRFDTGGGKVLLISAADAPSFEMAEFYAPGGKPLSFNPSVVKDHKVIEPDSHYREAKEEFETTWKERHPTEKGHSLKTLSVSLVYLPLYLFIYMVGGTLYRASTDAVWGRVYADEWPPSAERKKNIVLGAIGFATLLAFFLESFLISFSFLLLIFYAGTAAVVYFLSLYVLEHLDSEGGGG